MILSIPNRAAPYGICDMADNTGWVSVVIDHDTAAFTANAIRSWWKNIGRERYPIAKSLVIAADGGGNGSRVRLWKLELKKLANEFGFPIRDCHLPPGTSKCNKIEHKFLSARCKRIITANWRGKPLVSHKVIVQPIGATISKTGLKLRCKLNANSDPKRIKVANAKIEAINLTHRACSDAVNFARRPSEGNGPEVPRQGNRI